MSIIARLGKNYVNLFDIIEQYEDELAKYPDNLTIKGKTLEFALKEQATWCAYYGERKTELKTLVNHFDIQINKVKGTLYAQYNENYNPRLVHTAINSYVDKEEAVINLREMQAEVKELLDKYDNVLDAFNRRGFALRDITAIRIASMNEVSL